MRALRSILRWLFALQVVLCGWQVVRWFSSPLRHAGTFVSAAWPYASAALAFLFAVAWYTTGKQDGRRKPWGIAASCVQLAVCTYPVTYLLVGVEGSASFLVSLLLPIGLSVAGIVAFWQISPEEFARAKPVRVPGDRTSKFLDQAVLFAASITQFGSLFLWWNFARTHGILVPADIVGLALIFAGDIATVFIHESAHAAVALLCEMKLLSFRAGPFVWQLHGGGWQFRFIPARILSFDGGVGAVPCHADAKPWHEVAMIAAGPLSNLLVAFSALPFVLRAGPDTSPVLWTVLAFAVSTSLITFALNLVPFLSGGGAYSDGARIAQLLSNSPVADLHRAHHAVQSLLVTSQRFRNLDLDLLRRAIAVCHEPVQATVLRLVLTDCFEDRGERNNARAAFEEAETFCLENVETLPTRLHAVFVFGSGFHRHNAQAVRAWWNKLQVAHPTEFDTDYFLAETCLHWMEGRTDEAFASWKKADAEAKRLPAFGAYELDRDRCARLKQELENVSLSAVSLSFEAVSLDELPGAQLA